MAIKFLFLVCEVYYVIPTQQYTYFIRKLQVSLWPFLMSTKDKMLQNRTTPHYMTYTVWFQAYITCTLGIDMVGYIMAARGTASIITSYMSGRSYSDRSAGWNAIIAIAPNPMLSSHKPIYYIYMYVGMYVCMDCMYVYIFALKTAYIIFWVQI